MRCFWRKLRLGESTDQELLALVERIAAAAERQSLAVEAAQQASMETSIAAAKKYAAETELIELETERRRR